MESIALDTNIAIDFLNNGKEANRLISRTTYIFLPIHVCGELLFGAKNSKKYLSNESRYQKFIDSCYLLNTSLVIAGEYARIRKELKDKGKPIPENDIWIAATCLVNEIPLAKRDKHFQYIDGLILVDLE